MGEGRWLGVMTKVFSYLGLNTCKAEKNSRLKACSHEASIWWYLQKTPEKTGRTQLLSQISILSWKSFIASYSLRGLPEQLPTKDAAEEGSIHCWVTEGSGTIPSYRDTAERNSGKITQEGLFWGFFGYYLLIYMIFYKPHMEKFTLSSTNNYCVPTLACTMQGPEIRWWKWLTCQEGSHPMANDTADHLIISKTSR